MIEVISRHMSSAPPTMRGSNHIKYDSNSIAKLARTARVLFSAAHNWRGRIAANHKKIRALIYVDPHGSHATFACSAATKI
jgi:hypothetical protein